MSTHNFTPQKLTRYSFLWSLARLAIAAVALFIGGMPPALAFNPVPALYGVIGNLLTLAWIISGAASAYLIYQWHANGQKVFGRKEPLDMVAFLVMVVSGFNLGLAGLLGTNIGMAISSNQFVFYVVGLLYLVCGVHLFRRWKAKGERLF